MSSRDDGSSSYSEFPVPSPKRRRVTPFSEDESLSSSLQPALSSRIKIQCATAEVEPRASSMLPASTLNGPTSLTAPTTSSTFSSLAVSPWLVHSLAALSITNPTPIQESCIPEILAGRDCIGGSRTGSGKTIAFAVPILQKWAEDPFGVYAVVLTPTRELALQIYEQFEALGTPHSLKTVLVTGGTDMRPQAVALSRRPHIVVATPGRLADHILSSGDETIAGLKRSRAVVLDEADRLLASGPGSMLPDLNTCLSALPPPTERLTLLFTATVTPEVCALKEAPRPDSKPPVFVSEIVDTDPSAPSVAANPLPPTLHQTYLQVPLTHKDAFVHVILSLSSIVGKGTIIFTNRTSTTDILHRTLHLLGHQCTSLHSSLPQPERARNLANFRAQKVSILIATDVASRGLDIPEVRFVINYDVPRNPTDYIHRVGRTARAGRSGTSITFVGQRDVDLIFAIEDYVGLKMTEWREEGVNVETRVIKGRTLKDVGEARMEAMRDIEGGRDMKGWRRKIRKDRQKRIHSD